MGRGIAVGISAMPVKTIRQGLPITRRSVAIKRQAICVTTVQGVKVRRKSGSRDGGMSKRHAYSQGHYGPAALAKAARVTGAIS